MNKVLKVGLPVMLHKEAEITAFLAAKRRIEEYGESTGNPIDVGVFLYQIPPALKPENLEKQIANQTKYKLPIFHAQPYPQGPNNLAHDASDAEKFGKASQLELAIEQCARLRDLAPSNGNDVNIDTHVGILVMEGLSEENPSPGIYSLEGFKKKRTELWGKVNNRFSELRQKARSYGMGMVLENVPFVTLQPNFSGFSIPGKEDQPIFQHYPFSSHNALVAISNCSLTFDSAHYAASRALPERCSSNNNTDVEKVLFELGAFSSWRDYSSSLGSTGLYLHNVKAIHLSNTHGIGVRLEKWPKLANSWGDGGSVEGNLDQIEMKRILDYGREKELPVMLEVEYDVPNIPKNEFREADKLLNYVLN